MNPVMEVGSWNKKGWKDIWSFNAKKILIDLDKRVVYLIVRSRNVDINIECFQPAKT